MQEFGGELPLPYLLGLERKHWQHNHRISTSLNYLICKKLMVDAHFQFSNYQAHLTQIDQFANAMLKSPHQRVLVMSWLNTLIFNVAALNDEYKQQLSHSLSLQSNDSHNVSIEILDNLQHSQRQCLAYLLNVSSLQPIVTSIKEHAHHTTSHRREHQTQYALLSTIHYLCQKMEITVSYDKQLGQKLQVLGQCSCECCQQDVEEKVRGEVNRLIFGNTQNNFDVKELESKLNNNYNANLIPIASLIDANYYNEQTKRVLFKGTSLSGAEVIQKLGKTMLGSYNKNQLFSESMLETDRVFQLVLSIIQYRHFDLYAIWMHLLNSQLEKERNNKEQEIATLICNFLYALLTEQQQFTDLIRYLAGRLTTECKFSTSVTMDLMKKLILNRFLLSPTLYYTYSQKQLPEEQFGTWINKIRLLFYPKKSLLKQSEQIEAILSRIIIYGPGNNSTKQPRFHNKRVIYHLDQSLKRDYQSIYCDLLEQYPKNNERNTSSEISFSFVRHNTSGQGQLTNRKQQKGKNMQMTPKTTLNIHIPQENYSINSILSRLNQKTAHNLASPKSEKSSKTVHTQLTDAPPSIDTEMAMIEELVNRRRLLGVARRAIDQRMAKRAQERNKMRYYFNQVHSQFEKVRREIEKDANQVRINIDLL